MAWSARVSNCEESIDTLARRYDPELSTLERYAIPGQVFYEPSEPIMVKGRKYRFKLATLRNTEGYNILIKVYGPHERVTEQILSQLERKLNIETEEVPSNIATVLEMVDKVLRRHKNRKP